MTDPDRLSHRASGLGGHLLRSARADAPSKTARARAAVAIGLAGGSAAVATATTATAAATASKLVAASAVVMLKWVGLAAVGGAITVGAVHVVTRPRHPTPAAIVPRPDAPTPHGFASPPKGPETTNVGWPIHSPPLAVLSVDIPTPSSAAPTPAIAAPVVPRNSPMAATFATSPVAGGTATHEPRGAAPANSLADELRALDRASSRLSAGNARAALDELDAHERWFKDGALAPEAAVLRIEALAASGDDAAAIQRATAFLAADPDSVQARRVRSVLMAIEAKKNP